jgi:carbamoyl-phosphate synthase small subunit
MAWNPDGILLSNGPGDPAKVELAIDTIRDLIGQRFIFGICMGHQLLGLALGAKTYKLKFGHRGSNHPVEDRLLKQTYMTSQNHGYAVDRDSLPADVKETHVNLNDKTLSGFYSQQRKVLGVQFHPESHPGPHDAESLFDFFVRQLL